MITIKPDRIIELIICSREQGFINGNEELILLEELLQKRVWENHVWIYKEMKYK